MVRGAPPYARLRFAREGTIGLGGGLPPGWATEGVSETAVADVDLSPVGPALTLHMTFDDDPTTKYASITLSDYVNLPRHEVAVLRVGVETSRHAGIAEMFAVVREFRGGGELVGQSVRPVPLAESAIAVVARPVSGPGHLLRPELSFRREDGTQSAGLTVRLTKMMFAGLYNHPGWLNAPAR